MSMASLRVIASSVGTAREPAAPTSCWRLKSNWVMGTPGAGTGRTVGEKGTRSDGNQGTQRGEKVKLNMAEINHEDDRPIRVTQEKYRKIVGEPAEKNAIFN